MGVKDNFTDAEWKNLVELPYDIGLTVIFASPLSHWGYLKESKELLEEPSKLASQSGSSGLVSALALELQAKTKDILKEKGNEIKKGSPEAIKTKTLEACYAATNALSKTTPEEATAYKRWVLDLGQKVAEAAKKKGEPITPKESSTIKEISTALGLI
jgi:hypothetical protein